MFEVLAIETIAVEGPACLGEHDLMSPYVWHDRDGSLSVLLRVVPRPLKDGDATGRIWYGRCSPDGLTFCMENGPLIVPGPGELDVNGCEDPTVVPTGKDCVVYYTGLDANGDAQMLYAEGPDARSLVKKGVALASSKTERNTKEAAVDRSSDGEWRLFYEYSAGCRSRIGLAFGEGPRGPWTERADPIDARAECWDSWHLSTGPLLMTDADEPVLFYNGADRDCRWAIGWVAFDRDCATVVARSENPLVGPPDRKADGRDIAFAASAVQTETEVWLYFSRNDRIPLRARLKRKTGTK